MRLADKIVFAGFAIGCFGAIVIAVRAIIDVLRSSDKLREENEGLKEGKFTSEAMKEKDEELALVSRNWVAAGRIVETQNITIQQLRGEAAEWKRLYDDQSNYHDTVESRFEAALKQLKEENDLLKADILSLKQKLQK